MTTEQIALRLYCQAIPLPTDPDADAREGEIEEWEGKIQLKAELERVALCGPSDWSRQWAEEFRTREGFIRFAHRREWRVFCYLVAGDITGALDEIAGQWRGLYGDEDRLLG